MSNPQVPISGSVGSAGPFPTLGSTPVVLPDADHVLIDPSETCYQQIIVTGALTADRNLVCPLVAGFTYLVVNNTTGGHNVLVGGVSGAKVVVPPTVISSGTWVTTDGTNYGQGGEGLDYVIWRPGGVTGGSVVTTFAAVQAAITAGARAVYIDSSIDPATTPGTGVTLNLSMLVGLYSFNQQTVGEGDTLTVADTDKIANLPYVGPGLGVILDSVTISPLTYTTTNPLLILDDAAMLLNDDAAQPGYTVPAGHTLTVILRTGAIGGQAVPLFNVAASGSLNVQATLESVVEDSALGSGAGATSFTLAYDASTALELPLSTSPGTPLVATAIDQYLQLDGGAYVIYRPGGVANGAVATTFAQLQAAVNTGAMDVYVDSSLAAATIPAGQQLTGNGVIRLYSYNGVLPLTNPSTASTLTIADTGSIQNLVLVDGALNLICDCTTTSALVYSQPGMRCTIRGSSNVQLAAGATVPAASTASGFLEFFVLEDSGISGVAGVPFLKATGGVALLFAGGDSNIGAQAIGQSSGTALIGYDDTVSVPAFTVGTVAGLPFSNDQAMAYGNGTANPTARNGGQPLGVGQSFFRADLAAGNGMPVWWNGTHWVTAAGVIQP